MNQKTAKSVRFLFLIPTVLYLGVLVYILFWTDAGRGEGSGILPVPFHGIASYLRGERSLERVYINYIGNLALFFPLGLLIPASFPRLRMRAVLGLGLGLTLLAETAQYLLSCGYSDVDDIIMNFLGVLLGAVIYYYIFGGRRGTRRSAVLTVLLLAVFFASAFFWVNRLYPQLFPDNMPVYGNQIAGENTEEYDMRAFCYKMSHGEVFLDWHTAKDRDGNAIENAGGSYFLTDTAVFALEGDEGDSYRVVGIEEMISAVADSGGRPVRLFMNEEGACRMVILERAKD